MDSRFQKLFEPIDLGPVRLKNRIVMPAMFTKYATAFGEMTQEYIDFYVERAKNGVGLIVVENTCVDWPAGKVASNPLRLDDEKFIQGLHDLAEAVHPYGTKLATNLQHAGRQSNPIHTEGQELVSASSVACKSTGGHIPHALTLPEVEEIVEKFAQAVRRTAAAGFDIAQLHGAHGYLISQFLSPFTNKRSDKYGGSFENRLRFPREIVARARELVGKDFPIELRLSGDELLEEGYNLKDGISIARAMVEGGITSVSVSAGIYEVPTACFPTMSMPRAVWEEIGAAFKQALDVPVTLVGKLDDPFDAVRVLEEGKADLVAIGRQHLADPEWARKVAEGRVDDIRPCIHCNEGCAGNLGKDWRVGCDVNPAVGHEVAYAIEEAPKRKKVLVAGGGPAGMEAARVAALRGHHVVLFEKSDQLGGLLNYAGVPDFKDDIRRYRRYLLGQLKKQWVETRLGQEVTPALVQEYNPDVVIVATGAQPKANAIPTAPGAKVLQAVEVLGAPIPEGRSAVVIGGGRVGVEVAMYLAEKGKKVAIVEMLPDWACDTAGVNKVEMIEKLEALEVPVLTNTTAKAIRTGGVEVVTNGEGKVLEADFVVTALGFAPDPTLAQELEGIVPELYCIGDQNGGTRIWGATHDAWRVARTI